jgi:hypothetical protein
MIWSHLLSSSCTSSGALSWQGLKAATKKQRYDRNTEKKIATPTDLLYRSFLNEFSTFLNYACALRFDDKLDYSHLRKLFRNLFTRKCYQYDYVFDWSVQHQLRSSRWQMQGRSGKPRTSN